MNSTAFHGTEKRLHDVEGSSAAGRLAKARRAISNDAAGRSAVMANSHGSIKPRYTYSTKAPAAMEAE